MPDEDRLEAVIRMLDELEDPRRICRVIARDYGVEERTVRNDLARARAEIASQPKLSMPDLREVRLRVALQRVKACIRKGDERNANAWYREVIRIEGHYAPDMLRMSTMEFADLQALDDAGLDRILEEERRIFFAKEAGSPPLVIPATAESGPKASSPPDGGMALQPLGIVGSTNTENESVLSAIEEARRTLAARGVHISARALLASMRGDADDVAAMTDEQLDEAIDAEHAKLEGAE